MSKDIADLVQPSSTSRLKAAMLAADEHMSNIDPLDQVQSSREDSEMPFADKEIDMRPFLGRPETLSRSQSMSQDVPVAPQLVNGATEFPKSADTAPATFPRAAYPKPAVQSQAVPSQKLKARAMRAVMLALNEGNVPWDDFNADHVRAYETICDQLALCMQTRRHGS